MVAFLLHKYSNLIKKIIKTEHLPDTLLNPMTFLYKTLIIEDSSYKNIVTVEKIVLNN